MYVGYLKIACSHRKAWSSLTLCLALPRLHVIHKCLETNIAHLYGWHLYKLGAAQTQRQLLMLSLGLTWYSYTLHKIIDAPLRMQCANCGPHKNCWKTLNTIDPEKLWSNVSMQVSAEINSIYIWLKWLYRWAYIDLADPIIQMPCMATYIDTGFSRVGLCS